MVVRTLGFLVIRRVLGLIGLGPAPDAKDVEIAVLRHQLVVLRRQVARPRYTPTERTLLATLARMVPREALGAVPGHPRNVAAVAPRAGAPPLDLSDDYSAGPTLGS